MRLLNFVLHLALVSTLFSLANYSFAQNQDPSSDHIVVVGNKSQPVAWNHENTLQKAILAAQPNGTVIIPSTYSGNDCNPLSNCNPGVVCVIDWRIGGVGSGNCNGGQSGGGGLGDPGNNGIVFRSGLNITRLTSFADIAGLWIGCTNVTFLRGDGNCVTPITAVNPGVGMSGGGSSGSVTLNLIAPTALTLGGVQSLASSSHLFFNSLSTSGVFGAAQPATTDLSDFPTQVGQAGKCLTTNGSVLSFGACGGGGSSLFSSFQIDSNTAISSNGSTYQQIAGAGIIQTYANPSGSIFTNTLAVGNVPNASLQNSSITLSCTAPFNCSSTTVALGTSTTLSLTLQGTDTKVMTAGTVSGTGASLCTDANGGATTTGCSAGGGTGSSNLWIQPFGNVSTTAIQWNNSALNSTRVTSFQVLGNFTSTQVCYVVVTIDNSADQYDMGIYSSGGTLLTHIGATAGSSVGPVAGITCRNWLSSISFVAGTEYWLATTGDHTTLTIDAISGNPYSHNCQSTPSAGAGTTAGALNSSVTMPSAVTATCTGTVTAGVVFF